MRARHHSPEAAISFFRRLIGLGGSSNEGEAPIEVVPEPSEPEPEPPAPVTAIACPNCGIALDPPPTSTRLCPSCRHRIVVRRSEGRSIYLTEAAVEVFETARDHDAQVLAWEKERHDWLQLARLVGVPEVRRRAIAERAPSAVAAKASRTLYLTTVELEVKAARRARRWEDVARMRRRQAAALFEESRSALPPGDEIVALYREGMTATLRELANVSKEAELVGSTCCRACRADNERVFRVADELRTPRLPHADCPRGLCACDWWPAVPAAKKRARRRVPAAAPSPAPTAESSTDASDDAAPPDEAGPA